VLYLRGSQLALTLGQQFASLVLDIRGAENTLTIDTIKEKWSDLPVNARYA
jgi:hypothetical protein